MALTGMWLAGQQRAPGDLADERLARRVEHRRARHACRAMKARCHRAARRDDLARIDDAVAAPADSQLGCALAIGWPTMPRPSASRHGARPQCRPARCRGMHAWIGCHQPLAHVLGDGADHLVGRLDDLGVHLVGALRRDQLGDLLDRDRRWSSRDSPAGSCRSPDRPARPTSAGRTPWSRDRDCRRAARGRHRWRNWRP